MFDGEPRLMRCCCEPWPASSSLLVHSNLTSSIYTTKDPRWWNAARPQRSESLWHKQTFFFFPPANARDCVRICFRACARARRRARARAWLKCSSTAFNVSWCAFAGACVRARPTKRDGLKDDRRREQKSNHLIATFFISIFCFMAAEGRRATPAVIHGRSGGRWAAPSLIGARPPAHPKHPHNYRDEYDLFFC